jgi:hypothetical protein
MKIEELLSEIKFKPRITNKSTSGVIQSPNLKYIANGCQAIAYYHKTHPNTVVKVAAVSGETDPLWQFLRICINHPNNPYFPKVFNHKIFNLKTITTEEEEYLETLPEFEYLPIYDNMKMQIVMVTEHLKEITPAEFDSALHNIGLTPLLNSARKVLQPKSRFPLSPELLWGKLMDNENGRKYLRKHSKDKHFSDAVRLLSPLLATGKLYADVHLGNIMLRNDGHVVFNDPLALISTDHNS